MEEQFDIPEESMRHIEALLARHHPSQIQRMFAQTLESRKSSSMLHFDAFVWLIQVMQAEIQQRLLSCPRVPRHHLGHHLQGHHGGLGYRLPPPSRLQVARATWHHLLLRPVRQGRG